MGREVPRVPYTTRLDSFILAATVLVFLSLVEVILTAALVRRERAELAARIDRASRVILPIAFVLVVVYTLAV